MFKQEKVNLERGSERDKRYVNDTPFESANFLTGANSTSSASGRTSIKATWDPLGEESGGGSAVDSSFGESCAVVGELTPPGSRQRLSSLDLSLLQ